MWHGLVVFFELGVVGIHTWRIFILRLFTIKHSWKLKYVSSHKLIALVMDMDAFVLCFY
jgi:hypothetical protein